MASRNLSRKLTSFLSNVRLSRTSNLPIELRFKAIGIGGSRLARRVGKLQRKLSKLTLGQQRIIY